MNAMIAYFSLDLKRIAQGDPDYPWPRPSCGCGHPKSWGHGFVPMIFAGFKHALRLRRYRCPACGCILRLRPAGYFKRHQSAAATIRETLVTRLGSGFWPKGCSSGCARHWLRGLKSQALAVIGVPALTDLIAAFDKLMDMGRTPVSRTI